MRKGKEFELLYEKLYRLDEDKYSVKSPAYLIDKITNNKREVDVLIEYRDSNNELRRISVECRDRNSVEDVTWIEQLIQKKIDLDVDCTIATTTSRFTTPAILKAEKYGIKIENAQKVDSSYIEHLTSTNYCELHFIYTKAIDIQFKDSRGIIINKRTLLKDCSPVSAVKESIEFFLNREMYERISIIDEIKQATQCDDILSKPEHSLIFFVKLNDDYVRIQNSFRKIVEFIVTLKIIPIKYSIPLTDGMIVNKLENNEVEKDVLVNYHGDDLTATHGNIGQDFYHTIKFGTKKDVYGRFIGFRYPSVTSMVITPDAMFSISFNDTNGHVFEHIMGKLDCSELWQ